MYYNKHTYKEDSEITIRGIDKIEEIYGKKFLITGATGLLGAFVIDMLMYINESMSKQIGIWALGRSAERIRNRFSSHVGNLAFHIVEQDVTEPLSIDVEFDYILNFAGDGYPEAFAKRPVETMTSTVIGSYNLLNYVKEHLNCRMLIASSGEVYGKIENISKISESDYGYIDISKVRACYPIAKRAAENLGVAFANEYNADIVIARMSHVYGGSTSDRDNRATSQFLRNGNNGDDIVLHSAGCQMRSYTYVADAIRGVMTILIKGSCGEAYNISNEKSKITIAGFAKEVAEICGVRCIFEIGISENDTPITYAVLDSTKLSLLGYYPIYEISDGIKRAIEIMRESCDE